MSGIRHSPRGEKERVQPEERDAPDRHSGATAKDKENRRIPFNPKGRLAAILKRRAALGPEVFVFGNPYGAYQPTIQTAWETLKLLANGLADQDKIPCLAGGRAFEVSRSTRRRCPMTRSGSPWRK